LLRKRNKRGEDWAAGGQGEKEWQEQIAASGIPAYWILGSKGYGFEVRDGETSLNDGGIVERKLAFSTRSSLLEVMSAYRDLAEQERWDVVRTKDANRLIAGTPAGGQVLVTASAGPDRTSVAIFYTIPR